MTARYPKIPALSNRLSHELFIRKCAVFSAVVLLANAWLSSFVIFPCRLIR